MSDSLVDRREIEKLLVITGALEAGVIDALAEASGPPPGSAVTANLVAQRAGTDPRATRIMLDALADLGLLDVGTVPGLDDEEGAVRYILSPQARKRLVDPGPDLERNSLLHQAGKARGWLDLPYVLEHGGPRPRERTQAGLRSFVRTMAEGDPAVLDEVVGRVAAYRGTRDDSASAGSASVAMLDAGGAVGHVALRFAAEGYRATLCDRPEVLEEAKSYQGERIAGLSLVPCDFNVALPDGPFDLVYLGNVYHIYGPEENAALSRRVFEVLAPGGTIAIRDFVLGRSPRAALFAVNMLQATERGGVWREDQYRSWLGSAGFIGVEVVDLEMSPNQLILGRRP